MDLCCMKQINLNAEVILNKLDQLSQERNNLISKLTGYERLLAKKSDIFLSYADTVADPVYQFSIDLTKIIYINPAAEKMWGISQSVLQETPSLWYESIHIEDRAMVHESILDMIKNNKKEIIIQYRLYKSDGTIVYVNDRIVLVKDIENKAYCIMGIVVDVSNFIKLKKNSFVYEQLLNTIRSEYDSDVISEMILKVTCNSFGWHEGEIWILDQISEQLYCIKIWHDKPDTIKELYEESFKLKIKVGSGFVGQVLRNNFPTLVTDFPEHKDYYRGKSVAKANLISALGLPIFFEGKNIGVMVFFSRDVKKIDQNEIQVLQNISNILGPIVDKKLDDKKLNYMTLHDGLTGLLNRNGLEAALSKCIDKAATTKTNMITIIFTDIDRFKLINQNMGFEVGDLLLKSIATKYREKLSDDIKIMSYIGGNKFILISDNIQNPEKIQLLVDRILSIINMPFIIKDKEIFVTLSIGVSIYPFDGLDHLSLLKNADIALYHAKAKGGNTVQYSTRTLAKAVSDTLTIENGLRHALAENQFVLHYQPKVDLKTGVIVGVEALVRWQIPQGGLNLPNTFIHIAEQSDLIVYISEWVLLEVCYHFPLLALQVPVAINISAQQFKKQYDIVSFITNLVKKLSIPPHFIEIEITESVLADDAQRSMEILTAFRNMGISIAIDDFGTGYSSFEYLQRFQPNRIKIDKSFIDNVTTDPSAAAIVRAIIALSKALKIKVIAEGVENEEQLKFLINEDCDEIQGYYFAKPLPIYELNQLIVNSTKLKFPT